MRAFVHVLNHAIFFDLHEECVHVMISVGPAGLLSACGKNFNVAIFSDTVNVINVKLCMLVELIELYQLIAFAVTLIVFQSHLSKLISSIFKKEFLDFFVLLP